MSLPPPLQFEPPYWIKSRISTIELVRLDRRGCIHKDIQSPTAKPWFMMKVESLPLSLGHFSDGYKHRYAYENFIITDGGRWYGVIFDESGKSLPEVHNNRPNGQSMCSRLIVEEAIKRFARHLTNGL